MPLLLLQMPKKLDRYVLLLNQYILGMGLGAALIKYCAAAPFFKNEAAFMPILTLKYFNRINFYSERRLKNEP